MYSLIKQHRDRVVDSQGDNVLAGFPSMVDAVESAGQTQTELKSRNEIVPENQRMEFRINITLGDALRRVNRLLSPPRESPDSFRCDPDSPCPQLGAVRND